MESIHRTVLLNESIEGLNLSKNSVVVDATFGGGGQSLEICKRYKGIKIIALDQDKGAWDRAKSKFVGLDCDITFINTNFRDLQEALKDFETDIDAIIFDLGLSSDQLDNSGRGFSFQKDEPLLMTMKEHPTQEDLRAIDIVNDWSEESLANIIYGYGEERFSRKIAKAIVDARQKKEIKTTFDLVEIIKEAIPNKYRKGKIHFATKTFQALRIAVNDELESARTGLERGFNVLKDVGRMSVISFHSLEDRIVKKFYKEKEKSEEAILINKKVILPSDEEVKNNKRSRSAKLRILEKIKNL